ncbi:mobilization protein [Legionella septentrionalis]|uniref:mobilization protein n=1 Tax=Legionella septentrionalis TaxID=2498109 RepID=UPI000F8CE420|nr:mobilization protein [Legionella septentrionalis]RUR14046.1 mobilization protein [Legionella septentrionalis]
MMSLGNPIQLRLMLDKQFLYQEEAAKSGKSLAAYLRDRLDKSDETLEAITNLRREITSLRLMVEETTEAKSNLATPGNIDPALFEILLLLRQLCRPEQLKIAQGELNRLGYSVRQW